MFVLISSALRTTREFRHSIRLTLYGINHPLLSTQVAYVQLFMLVGQSGRV